MKREVVRERVKNPTWEGAIEGWTVNHVRNQLWRFQPLYEFDDLLQEAWLLFHKCTEYYPDVKEERHFMSLYMRAVRCRFTDLAYKSSRVSEKELHRASADGDDESFYSANGAADVTSFAPVDQRLWIEDAPPEVRAVLEAVMDRPTLPRYERSGPDASRGRRQFPLRVRETTTQYLCRVAGVEYRADIVERVKQYLNGRLRPAKGNK